MKTFKTLPQFESKSNNTRILKPLTKAQEQKFNALMKKAQSNGLKNFALIYNVNGEIYGLKTPIENCVARIKVNATSAERVMFKIFSPLAKNQVIELAQQGKLTYYGNESEFESIKKRHKLQNNGQAVEYMVNKKERTTIDHKQTLLQGGDNLFGDTEIKYFVIGNSSPSCRLFENIKA